MNSLCIVVPCFNEEEVLPITAPLFLSKLNSLIKQGKITDKSRILFVNDGSKDKTWEIISKLSSQDYHFCGISQSRNRGHQNAVLAGLMEAKDQFDVMISIDCDGQDDLNAMDAMIDQYMKGHDVVYGVRNDRSTDTFFKKYTAEFFYRLLTLMGVESIFNHADYRLTSSRVIQAFSEFKEVNLFLRGMFPLVGFSSTSVYYSRNERMAGQSHYPFKKMLALAVDGITSLSIKPIRLITTIGILVSLLSFLMIIYVLVRNFTGHTISGWSSLAILICFIGGVQLTSIGVLGEYIGKIYLEVKHRPRYIISDKVGF